MFGFIKRNLSAAKRRTDAVSGEKGGKGVVAPMPASALKKPEEQLNLPGNLGGPLTSRVAAGRRQQAERDQKLQRRDNQSQDRAAARFSAGAKKTA